jgi:bifunctional UDP-N-acetylglucosamine pyrophosphorylase/glucosamine-1-phosphate N-acetyltransferase
LDNKLDKNISIVILAAGKGSRMKSTTPKVLHKISGKPMLYYSIKEAQKISDDITVVIYHQASLVKKSMQKEFDNINFVVQNHDDYPGTGGAIMGIDFKHDRVLILNGDMPLIQESVLRDFINTNSKVVMSVIKLDNPSGYGRVKIQSDKVIKIIEQKDANEEELKIKSVNAGVYMMDKSILDAYLPKLSNNNAQKEYYVTDIIEMAVDDNLVVSPLFVKQESFKGVNSKYDLAKADEIMQDRIKKNFMQNGVIFKLPSTIYIDSDVEIEGESIIENGVTLLDGAKIINSHIKTNSVVEDSIIKNSSIGPMARIRPKSSLSDTHIGNFVEVKKSTLNGVKAGHLSYIGDATIDSGTNIGAGTITCNYDGISKHQTIIGKNVFVGSDTQLVAPIKIEDDVMIGAGSTITKDVSSGNLVLSRTPQKSIKGFFYKFFKRS